MSMEYVCTGAKLRCSLGTLGCSLKATPKNVTLVGRDQANVTDTIPTDNVPGFGKCWSPANPPTMAATAAHHGVLTPGACALVTMPRWFAVDPDSLVCGEPALLKPATLQCKYGGIISIVNPGQELEIK